MSIFAFKFRLNFQILLSFWIFTSYVICYLCSPVSNLKGKTTQFQLACIRCWNLYFSISISFCFWLCLSSVCFGYVSLLSYSSTYILICVAHIRLHENIFIHYTDINTNRNIILPIYVWKYIYMCICVCHAHRKVGFAKYSIHAISLANSYKRCGLFWVLC